MKRLALVLALLPAIAHAEGSSRVVTGGARQEAGAAIYGGADSAGVAVWIDGPEVNRTAYAAYVYRWQGFVSGTMRYRLLLQSPHAALYFRTTETVDGIFKGGTAVGLGQAFGLGGRLGTASGSFSAVIMPTAGVDGFWVIREGTSGFSGRFPVGFEAGVEGNIGRVVPFALVRPLVDLWPKRTPAFRFEATAGIGVTFDWPRKREKGQPAPPGP